MVLSTMRNVGIVVSSTSVPRPRMALRVFRLPKSKPVVRNRDRLQQSSTHVARKELAYTT